MLHLDPPSKGSHGTTNWAIVVASINVDILACDVADRCSCRGWCACGCLHRGWPISPLGVVPGVSRVNSRAGTSPLWRYGVKCRCAAAQQRILCPVVLSCHFASFMLRRRGCVVGRRTESNLLWTDSDSWSSSLPCVIISGGRCLPEGVRPAAPWRRCWPSHMFLLDGFHVGEPLYTGLRTPLEIGVP